MKEGKTFNTKSVDISIPSQNLVIDPRSKSTANGAFNQIPTGDVVEVKGTRRMLKSKSKKATWY
tara:strand:+ start:450 stop:641 length:192 start_codon:yes stop_codon:yes gene_type:complete